MIVTIPKVLRDKLGEDGAEALADLLSRSNLRVQEDVITLVSERFERRLAEELAKVRQEMADFRAEVKAEIAGVRAELKTEIAGVRAELKTEIAGVRADLIRWMFVFWVGQVAVLTGILVALLRR